MASNNVRINITARDRTRRAFGTVNRSLTAMRRGMFSLKAGIVGAVGAAGLGGMVKNAIESADAIGKTADKLGITTDALQEFRFAAKLSGVSTNTLDMALQRFTRRAAEAAKGTGEAKAALKQMGIQLKDSNGNMRSSSDLLMDVADSFTDVEDESERLRLAFKLFDSEGAALVNMLGNGSAALQKMRDDARELGIVMDEELIRNAEEVNDKFTTAMNILGVQFKSVLISLSPHLMEIAKWLKEAGVAFKEWNDGIDASTLRGYSNDIEYLSQKYKELADGMSAEGFRSEAATAQITRTMRTIENEIGKTADKVVELDRTVEDFYLSFHEGTGQVSLDFVKVAESAETMSDGVKTGVSNAKNAMLDYSAATKSAMATVKSSIESNLTDALMKAKTFGDAFKSIMNEVARQIIKTQIATPIATGISGAIGDLDLFGSKVPVTAHSGGVIGYDSLPKYHSGGMVGGGLQSSEVPAILQKGEMVLTREQQKAVGNNVVNVTYAPQVNALDPRTAATVIAQNAPTVVGIVRQAFARNGRAVAI